MQNCLTDSDRQLVPQSTQSQFLWQSQTSTRDFLFAETQQKYLKTVSSQVVREVI